METFLNGKQAFLVLDSAIRSIAQQLLETLDFLHSKNIIHRELKPSSVFIENITTNIKLADYALVKKLNNLSQIINNDASSTVQGSLRSDIHELGLLLLSLKLGEKITDYHPQIPQSLQPDFRNFISICTRADKVECKHLLKHQFILKETAESASIPNKTYKRSISIHYDEDEDGLTTFTDYPSKSRLNTEFEVIGVIGHGAFGEVLKVKNKLDSRFYAIKRIRVNPTSKHNKQITREFKLLSMLNHENVVRYYSTWVEKYDEVVANPTTNAAKTAKRKSSQNSESSSENFPNLIKFKSNGPKSSFSSSSSSGSEESNRGGVMWSRKESLKSNDKELLSMTDSFGSDLSSSPDSSLSRSFSESSFDDKMIKKIELKPKLIKKKNEDTDDSVIFAENSADQLKKKMTQEAQIQKMDKKEEKVEVSEEESDTEQNVSKSQLSRNFIYIQMEYCGGKTLKDLIDKGWFEFFLLLIK